MVETNVYLKQVYVWSGAGSVNEFLFDRGVLTLAISVLSNLFALAVHWAILRFSHGLGYSLSQERVTKMYLRQPYAFFLDRNSVTLTLNATGEVDGVVNGVVIPLLQTAAKQAEPPPLFLRWLLLSIRSLPPCSWQSSADSTR